MSIAVIPARGGSKRIPRKNVRAFCGAPMIGYSIRAAIESGCFDQVVVSTDNDEIAEVAQACGAAVPFRRPAELADDLTPTVPVVAQAVEALGLAATLERPVCCLYATAPFVREADIRAGLARLLAGDVDYVLTVTSFGFPIQRALQVADDGRIRMVTPEHEVTRSQDLPPAFHDAGQFYWGRAGSWLGRRPLYTSRTAAIRLPRHRVQDIDDEEDFARAELMYRALAAVERGTGP